MFETVVSKLLDWLSQGLRLSQLACSQAPVACSRNPATGASVPATEDRVTGPVTCRYTTYTWEA